MCPSGEDGSIRAWTADRGKLLGTRRFSTFSSAEQLQEAIDGGKRASLDDRIEDMEGAGAAVRGIGDVPIPVCALSSCGAQPLIAVGLCHGTVHIVFVKQVNRRY